MHATNPCQLASNAHAWICRSNPEESTEMKNILLAVGGFCAAAAGILVWHATRTPNVEELAHSLEEAWADHHTSL
jgi:hypothetical protein